MYTSYRCNCTQYRKSGSVPVTGEINTYGLLGEIDWYGHGEQKSRRVFVNISGIEFILMEVQNYCSECGKPIDWHYDCNVSENGCSMDIYNRLIDPLVFQEEERQSKLASEFYNKLTLRRWKIEDWTEQLNRKFGK
jgi:hypothetical protein